MDINYYRLGNNYILESITSDAVTEQISKPDYNYLIDLVDPSIEELQDILNRFKFHSSIIDNCIDSQNSSLFESYENQYYIQFPEAMLEGDSLKSLNITFLRTSNIMIIIRKEQSSDIIKIIEEINEDQEIEDGGSLLLLFLKIQTFLVKKESTIFFRLRKETDHLADIVLNSPESLVIKDMIKLKRQVEDFLNIVEDQLFCNVSIKRVKLLISNTREILNYIDDLTDDIERGITIISRLNIRLTDYHNYFQTTIDQKTNSRLRLLTIISSIFLPITLIAGIFGMNFYDIPGINWKYGYEVTILSMIITSAVLISIFYFRGWLK